VQGDRTAERKRAGGGLLLRGVRGGRGARTETRHLWSGEGDYDVKRRLQGEESHLRSRKTETGLGQRREVKKIGVGKGRGISVKSQRGKRGQ